MTGHRASGAWRGEDIVSNVSTDSYSNHKVSLPVSLLDSATHVVCHENKHDEEAPEYLHSIQRSGYLPIVCSSTTNQSVLFSSQSEQVDLLTSVWRS